MDKVSDKVENKNKKSFVKGALILTVGGVVAKVLGAVYRIPLTNLLGTEGTGLYQLVFPLFMMLITLSTGLSVAISRLVAQSDETASCLNCRLILRCGTLLSGGAGLLFSVLLFVFADGIAEIQGNVAIAAAYRALSPAVFLVSVASALKGYFAGVMKMFPNALSQIAEQTVKLVAGLLFARAFLPDVNAAVSGAVFAVTLSEVAGTAVLLIAFLKERRKPQPKPFCGATFFDKKITADLLKIALPVTLCGVLLPLSQLTDSAMVLKLAGQNATRLYGVWSGPVHSMYAMPVILAGGVAAAILPSISGSAAARDAESIQKKVNVAFKMDNVIVLPCAVGFLLLSKQIISLLYGALPQSDVLLAAELLTICSAACALITYHGTFSSVLNGLGKEYVSLLILVAGITVKTVVNFFLLPIANINVFAVAFSTVLCYLLCVAISAVYLKKLVGIRYDVFDSFVKPLANCVIMAAAIITFKALFPDFADSAVGTLVIVAVAGAIYVCCTLAFNVFEGVSFKAVAKKFARGKNNENIGVAR